MHGFIKYEHRNIRTPKKEGKRIKAMHEKSIWFKVGRCINKRPCFQLFSRKFPAILHESRPKATNQTNSGVKISSSIKPPVSLLLRWWFLKIK
jgi:hypothetical protein